MPTGSTVFLEQGTCIIVKAELAKLRKDSAELVEIKEAMQDAVKDIEVEPVVEVATPSTIEGWR